MMGMFLTGLICSAPLRQINPYVTDMHGPAFAATIVSIYAFIGIFGKLILGTINDRAGAIKSSMLAFGFMAVSFFLLILGTTKALYIMTLFYGIGNGVGTVLAPLLISATFGVKNFTFMCGITRSPLQLGMSLGGLLLAFVFDFTGSYTWGWIICILLSFMAAICFYWAYKRSIKAHSAMSSHNFVSK
jgi:MFS family permease